MKIYCLYDKKALCFLSPFMVVNNEISAVRNVIGAVNSSGNLINQYPEDFCLMYLGEFESDTGVITQPDVKPVVNECLALVRPEMNGRINSSMNDGVSPAAEER